MRKSAGQRSDEQVKATDPNATVGAQLSNIATHLAMLDDVVRSLHQATTPIRRPVSIQLPTPESTTTDVHILDELINLDHRLMGSIQDISSIISALAIGDLDIPARS